MRAIKTTTIAILAVGLLAGSAVGVAAQDEGAAPVQFTGIVDCGPQIAGGTSETVQVPMGESVMTVLVRRGNTWQPSAREVSDPRLEGRYTISYDTDAYYPPGVVGSTDVGAGTWRIENDEGAWQGSYHIAGIDGGDVTVTVPLIGEGAYAGLFAIVESAYDSAACSWDWRGLIVDGELPAYPEPPAE